MVHRRLAQYPLPLDESSNYACPRAARNAGHALSDSARIVFDPQWGPMPTIRSIDGAGDEERLPGDDFPESEWTNTELDEWYEDTPGADDIAWIPISSTEELRDALGASYQAMEDEHELFFHREWQRLRTDVKAEFRRQFEDRQAELVKKRRVNFIVVAGGALIVLLFLSWYVASGPGSSNTLTAGDQAVQQAGTEEPVVWEATEGAVSDETETGDETAAAETEEEPPSGGLTIPATKMRKFTVEKGSYIFTVEVEGNGREMATAENTRWYSPRFIVTTTGGSFVVTAKWSGNRDFRGRAFLGTDLADLIVDATVTGEWPADNTFVVVADNLGIDDAPVSAIVEMTVRVTDDTGGDIDYEDTITWEP